MKNVEKKKGPATVKAKPSEQNTSIYNANFKGLVDVVLVGNQVQYLVKSNGELLLEKEHREEQGIYKPPRREKLPITLLNSNDVIDAYRLWQVDSSKEGQRLFLDIVKYLKGISDLPNIGHYIFLAAWIMHTYRQEDIQYSPILCFYGVAERGKTRTGKALTYLAYRGIRLNSLREASIFRSAENLKASLFFDISDMWDAAKRNNCEDILLNRFELGSTVPRVLYPEKGAFEDTHYYEVFGPTIIATNTPLNDILETRSIVISMKESTRKFSNEVSQQSASILKAQLLAFRAFYLNENFPEPDKLFPGRLGDILRPLHKIIQVVSPDDETGFIVLASKMRLERVTDKAITPEGAMLRTIVSLKSKVRNGILSVEDITIAHNLNKPDRFHISSKRVGRIVQSLGFYSGEYRPKTSNGNAAISWDEEFISSLAMSYGLEFRLEEDFVSEFSGVSDLLHGVE